MPLRCNIFPPDLITVRRCDALVDFRTAYASVPGCRAKSSAPVPLASNPARMVPLMAVWRSVKGR